MQKNPSTYHFSQISRVRNVLFGIATLLIVAFHSVHLADASAFPFINKITAGFLYYGNIGVDIFLFLSGVGLYYSFSKNRNVKTFYLRRGIRLLPALLLVLAAHNGLLFLMKKITFVRFLSNTLLLSFFIDGDKGAWFFSLLIALYLVYPALHKVLEKHRSGGLVAVCAGVSAVAIALFIFNRKRFNMYELALMRVYVFVFGAWMGKIIKDKVSVRRAPVLIACAGVILCGLFTLWYFRAWLDMNRYVIRLIYCPLAIAIVMLFSMLIPKKKNVLNTALIWIGGLSCEVYLLYERIDYFLFKKVSPFFPKSDFAFLYYVLLFAFTLVCAFLLSKGCGIVQKKLSEKLKI